MRNLILTVFAVLTILSFTGCHDRDIIDEKEFGHSLLKVEHLKYTRQDGMVQLSWDIPSSIPAGFRRPLEVSIQKVENNIYREIIIVGGEGKSRDIAIAPDKSYKFVVKLAGFLTDEARERGKSDRVYSEGQVIEIQ